MKRRRGRQPTADELSLWHHATRHVERARDEPFPSGHLSEAAADASVNKPRKADAPVGTSSAQKPGHRKSVPSPHGLSPLDRRTVQKVRRGRQEIGGRLDLHGLRRDEARRALVRYLEAAQGRGAKVVLVITGKGSAPRQRADAFDLTDQPGVLRREVPMWLGQSDLRPMIVGFEEADRRHGGTGALYVFLKRRR
ncbi:MAG: Smr/MutS family protein [Pseudomonadota bacterium]